MDDLRHAREHTGRDQEDMLAHHSIECDLEEVDAFVSHAWDDDHEQRYVALRAWATQFESEHGRTPIIWLGMRSFPRAFSRSISPLSPSCVSLALSDKACIDQSSIEESLQCLPIFLSHCDRFVVLGGPHWLSRLWWYVCLLLFHLRFIPAPHTQPSFARFISYNLSLIHLSCRTFPAAQCSRAFHLPARRRRHQRRRVPATPRKGIAIRHFG